MQAIDELVDSSRGVVSRQIFVDDEIFREEQQRIFARAWLFVGHESLIPNPNDYFVSRMGTEPVILTRTKQNQIVVLLNTCTHRGMKVCRYDQGNSRTFTCPYHGWTFATDTTMVARPGELFGVPGHDTHYHGKFDKSPWGLKAVAQVFVYKGTIWATWDPDAPPFLDYLGDMRHYLDAGLDHRDGSAGGSVLIGGVQKWRVRCNWKFPAENFIGDMYHDVSHRSVDLVGIGPSGGKGRRDPMPGRMTIGFENLGHGVIGRLPHYAEPDYAPLYQQHPEVEAYYRAVYAKRVATLGERMRVTHSVGTIFPNMSFHGRQPRTIAVFHPISATEMEMWRMYLIDHDAPPAVRESARHYYMRYSGPGGMTESDDMENWTAAMEASSGTIARTMTFNYQMGLGDARPVPGLRGAVENGEYTEENARIYYRRWAQFMSAMDWQQLLPAQPAAAMAADTPASTPPNPKVASA